MTAMTLREAKSLARRLGLTLRKMRSGDYRVNFRDGNENTAYYTDSLEDAVNTLVETDPRLKPILDLTGMPALRQREPGHDAWIDERL